MRFETGEFVVDHLPDRESFGMHYRYRETFYHITLRNGRRDLTVKRVVVDGYEQPEKTVPLVDDRNDHYVEVEVG